MMMKMIRKGMFRPIAFTLINQMSRVSTDILFYTNPIAFEQLQRNALPIFTVVQDGWIFTTRAANLLTGGEDTYQQGVHKDQSETMVAAEKLAPGVAQWHRLLSASYQEYQSKE